MSKIIEILILKNTEYGFYPDKKSSQTNDKYLIRLMHIFDDSATWTRLIREELLNQSSGGITGNKSEVIIEGNIVTIEPQFVDNPEDYAIKIDRAALLQIIVEWEKLIDRNCQQITFTRYEDGTISIFGE